MSPATSKSKKQHFIKNIKRNGNFDDDVFHHEHLSRPKEKKGKRRFKLQCEVDDYLLSIH